jgi:hypothetical protein
MINDITKGVPMSLTSQLGSGALGSWCRASLTGTSTLVDQVQQAAYGHDPIRPVGQVDPDYWATIGGAFGQRLAFLVAHEPPYAAYLGAANAGLLGGPTLDTITSHWPTHRHLGISPGTIAPGSADEAIEAFTSRLVEHLATMAPVGQLAITREAEGVLAQACWVLTGWEAVYRGGELPPALAWLHERLPQTDGDPVLIDVAVNLLNLEAPETITQELVTLAGRLHGSGSLGQLQALRAGQRLGISQPVFVPHWADGDVIVGDTLIDCKTVITLKDRDRIARWLHQLAAYAWLDEADHYGICRVGLYLARHGVLITWGRDQFEHTLLGRSGDVRAARSQFLRIAHDAMTYEGAKPLTTADHMQMA